MRHLLLASVLNLRQLLLENRLSHPPRATEITPQTKMSTQHLHLVNYLTVLRNLHQNSLHLTNQRAISQTI